MASNVAPRPHTKHGRPLAVMGLLGIDEQIAQMNEIWPGFTLVAQDGLAARWGVRCIPYFEHSWLALTIARQWRSSTSPSGRCNLGSALSIRLCDLAGMIPKDGCPT